MWTKLLAVEIKDWNPKNTAEAKLIGHGYGLNLENQGWERFK